MAHYTAPTRDSLFILDEVLDIYQYQKIPGYDLLTPDLVRAIVEEAGRFASEIVTPLNAVGDAQGCTRNPDGQVVTPDGYAAAFRQFQGAGWGNLTAPIELGGQGLPELLKFVQNEFLTSASPAFSMCAGGPAAIFEVLEVAASAELKAKYLPRLVTGEWTGTMNLTEPHCGSDVGLLRTRAEPQPDGSYRITGNKIFISGGEHDLTENILHLVLARTPGAPPGAKGISLFLVPKILVNDDGSLGERNALSCSAIEHKMGLRGSPTCAMDYDGAVGWMVGPENKGLAGMFILMNAARLSVGIQGLGAAEVAYQNAAAYALERRQGRAITGAAEPDQIADPLIVHADVRRMLMDARAFIAPMRALALWCGLLVDISRRSPDEGERKSAEATLALLTPILKGYGTERGLRTTIDMQQIWGGHGYIVETGMEQFVRDVRIALIYEGANGIQATDLVLRKLGANGGALIQSFFRMIDAECERASSFPGLSPIVEPIAAAAGEMKAATDWLTSCSVEDRAAAAFYYLEMAGIVSLGLMWLKIAQAAARAIEQGTAEPHFYDAKLRTALYFAERFTPDVAALRSKIEVGAGSMMSPPAHLFADV